MNDDDDFPVEDVIGELALCFWIMFSTITVVGTLLTIAL